MYSLHPWLLSEDRRSASLVDCRDQGMPYITGSMSGFTGQADTACSTKKGLGRGWVLFFIRLSGVASSAIHWPILRFAAAAADDDDVLLER